MVFKNSRTSLIARKSLDNGFYYNLEKGSRNRSILLLRIARQNIAGLGPWSKEESLPYWLPFSNASDHCYLNGYVYTKPIKRDIMECVRWSEVIYQKVKICHKLIDNFLAAAKEYAKEGINVWAFRPPTCGPMRDLEGNVQGFTYDWFVDEFKKAGGRNATHPTALVMGSGLSAKCLMVGCETGLIHRPGVEFQSLTARSRLYMK